MRCLSGKWSVLVLTAIIAFFVTAATVNAESSKIMVFAAASTTNAVTDISKKFEESTGIKVQLSFASSSTLAKQIEKGAPADVYLSANPKWMNYLEEKNAVDKASRFDLLGNRIVLIAPENTELGDLTISDKLNLKEILKDGRLAMGNPDHVPAGIYGKKGLEKLGLWESVKDDVARAKDVRAALVLVERAEAPLGVVYSTDAAISKHVKVVGIFPEDSHPSIIYPAAMVKKSKAAESFLKFLTTKESSDIFKKYGFKVQ